MDLVLESSTKLMPKVSESSDSVNLKVFGQNVRDMRRVRGWSIDALAKRAGVAAYTVHRIEHGYPSTKSRRTRIAYALDTIVDRLGKSGPPVNKDVSIHYSADDHWLGLIDWRPTVPEDNDGAIQNPAERSRLGRLGFVTQFVKILTCRLPKGKLVSGVLELYGELTPSCYLGGEIFALAFKGDSLLHYNGQILPLPEGSATTFDCTKPFFFSPAHQVPDGGDPTLVVYVRLEETEPIDSRRQKRGRKVEGQFEVWVDPDGKVPDAINTRKKR